MSASALPYLTARDQEIVAFMAAQFGHDVSEISGARMLKLIEQFEDSEEWQTEFAAGEA